MIYTAKLETVAMEKLTGRGKIKKGLTSQRNRQEKWMNEKS